jgi:hypothetical protein
MADYFDRIANFFLVPCFPVHSATRYKKQVTISCIIPKYIIIGILQIELDWTFPNFLDVKT